MSGVPINVLLLVVVAMSISMALIPLMIRLAPALGMIDRPDPRKVHSTPIPRVGGIGIVVGALIPLLIWLPSNDLTVSYLLGSAVLLLFGIWDDARELGHYIKFAGQFIAVLLVVYYGGLSVHTLPFTGIGSLNSTLGELFTVFALVGMINAINHSDGLDGLAGGESIMSLAAITFLAYLAGDQTVVFIAVAAIGGLFGFLRFNSHPARVFMGDGGSQYLGFTLGFLAVYLTQIANPALSAALPALLLGLPIVDILAVVAQRAYQSQNLFRASKNHIHHRLLGLQFHHYESVIIIYSVQALLVVSAVLLPYESDMLLMGIYVSVSTALFLFLITAERSGWRAHEGRRQGALVNFFVGIKGDGKIVEADRYLIQVLLAGFLLVGAMFSTEMPRDMSFAAGVLFVMLLIRLLAGYRLWFLFLRLIIFVTVAFVAYLIEYYPPALFATYSGALYGYYVVLAVAIGVSIRYSRGRLFEVTPLDYLVVLIVVALAILSEKGFVNLMLVRMGVELVILFYGAEVVIKQMKNRWNLFTFSVLAALAIAALRGVM
jgi:UDP-GlcNAc:undecaprenyl-phosphate/decaprenyl-phosphate GlcNAc-1-phosphate transferase